MAETQVASLEVVDVLTLDAAARAALLPAPSLVDEDGCRRRLPRYFFRVPSWDVATETVLAEHFTLAELMRVDVREAAAVRDFPRYVPCAITVLAAHLELFRRAADAPVYVAANGGYRSPGHRLTRYASTHCWGTAANLYRIGDEFLDTRESIERWSAVVGRVIPCVWTRPFGQAAGYADDHLHIDLGYLVAVPRAAGYRREPD